MYIIALFIMSLGIANAIYSGATKWKTSLLLMLSFGPTILAVLRSYVLINISVQTAMFASYIAWSVVLLSHAVLVGVFFINKNSKHSKAFFLACLAILIVINLPIYEGHEGWGFHKHTIWGLSFHFH